MDIFQKCDNYTLANELRAQGLFPYFRELESRQDTEVIMEGKRRIMLGSNNYLGLTTNPEIVAAGKKALDEYGTGCSGSRLRPRRVPAAVQPDGHPHQGPHRRGGGRHRGRALPL